MSILQPNLLKVQEHLLLLQRMYFTLFEQLICTVSYGTIQTAADKSEARQLQVTSFELVAGQGVYKHEEGGGFSKRLQPSFTVPVILWGRESGLCRTQKEWRVDCRGSIQGRGKKIGFWIHRFEKQN